MARIPRAVAPKRMRMAAVMPANAARSRRLRAPRGRSAPAGDSSDSSDSSNSSQSGDFLDIDVIAPTVYDLTEAEHIPQELQNHQHRHPRPITINSSDLEGSDNDLERSPSIRGGIDSDDEGGVTSDDEDIPNPCDGISAPTIADLQNKISDWAKEKGFAVIRAHGKKDKKSGQYKRYHLVCDRAGKPRCSTKSAGLRETSSRKCGCAWK
ncbi:hypothetical protein B0H63DRAFT_509886, partial [Podospora didyma]